MSQTPETLPNPTSTSKPRAGARAGLVGPLFLWELIRLARRGQDARARFLLASGLLIVLTLFTLIWFRTTDPYELFFGTSSVLSSRDSAKFGEQFTIAFLLAQLAILVLLTPAYSAGAISEEKERKTFHYLLICELTDREIVFGKLLGRLTFLMGVLFAGLPVLALTQVYGGTSEKFLLVGYLITACTVVMFATVSVSAAIAVETYRGALFRGYGFAALICLVGGVYPIFSPFAFILLLWGIESDSSTAFWVFSLLYCGVELGIACVAIFFSIRWVSQLRAQPVRRKGLNRKSKPPVVNRVAEEETVLILEDSPEPIQLGAAQRIAVDEPIPTAARIAIAVPQAKRSDEPRMYRRPRPPRARRFDPPDPHPDRPKVWESDPFYWKEYYTTGTKRTADDDQIRGVMIAIGVAIGILVAFMVFVSAMTILANGFSQTGIETASRILLTLGFAAFFTYLLVVGSSSAGCIVQERHRLTLESLLTIPVDRSELLWPKWRVAFRKGWWWGLPSAMLLPIGISLSSNPYASIPTFGLVLASVPLVTSYGMWLSLRCRTMTRAVLWTLPVLAGLALTPILVNWIFANMPLVGFSVLSLLALAVLAAAVGFWFLSLRDFHSESQLS